MKRPDALAFENAYADGGRPTWETGRPQPAVLAALEAGWLTGRILDVGCGTGLHARLLAERGFDVTGVDFAGEAIERAKAGPPTNARFAVADARALDREPGFAGAFDAVLDVGCLHTLQPGDRAAFASSVRGALRPGGRLVLLAWSDRNPFGRGPARMTEREIRSTLADGWIIERIEPSTLESLLPPGHVHAWRVLARTTEGEEPRPAPGGPPWA